MLRTLFVAQAAQEERFLAYIHHLDRLVAALGSQLVHGCLTVFVISHLFFPVLAQTLKSCVLFLKKKTQRKTSEAVGVEEAYSVKRCLGGVFVVECGGLWRGLAYEGHDVECRGGRSLVVGPGENAVFSDLPQNSPQAFRVRPIAGGTSRGRWSAWLEAKRHDRVRVANVRPLRALTTDRSVYWHPRDSRITLEPIVSNRASA